ncbi:HEAT repeat family protein [Histomonas meleagridis]|uniref:HEAT repeat family protein n=1 Tax=Histomonas meleagridis TaxID=135588 RepID=UPI00355A9153|nr:HEAT repeat family protein [Histomonas meleagridis]KAH0803839.1 HEAT repeat family protein [Histomonas meleagridis]
MTDPSYQNLTYDLITLNLPNSKQLVLLEEVKKVPSEQVQKLTDYIVTIWKKYPLHQEGLRILRILSSLNGFDKSKIVPIIFEILNIIDKSKKDHQFLSACRYASKILTVNDIPSKPTLPVFTVIRFMKINDESSLTKFAEEFAECLTKVTDLQLPSFHYAHAFSLYLPKDIYMKTVIPRFERQLLRGSASFLPVCTYTLPEIDLPVNEKSAAYTMLSEISSKGSNSQSLKLIQHCSKCFNTNELFSASLRLLTSANNIESKVALSSVISKFDSRKLTGDSLQEVYNRIKSEQNAEIQSNLILSLKNKADESFDFIKSIKITSANIDAVCDVLINSTKQNEIVEFLRPLFGLSPSSVARVILQKGFEKLSNEELSSVISQTKNISARFEALILDNQMDKCIEMISKSTIQYMPIALTFSPTVLKPFIYSMIYSEAVSNKVLIQFKHIVKNSKQNFDEITLAIFCPETTKPEIVPKLLELIPIRGKLAGDALSYAGFTKEQHEYVKNTFDKYFEDPLSEEDTLILLNNEQNEVFEKHSSAEKYNEIKEEILHPTAKSNLPQLKKQIEKVKVKTITNQQQIRQNLNQTKVKPIKDCVNLLISHYHNLKRPVTASLTTFTSDLINEFRSKLCDTEAITSETNIEILLPIYLEHSNISDDILEFAIAMCVDISATRLKVAFEHLLDDNEMIRICSLNCIAVSNFDVPITSKLVCIFNICGVSNQMALDLMERINAPKLEPNEIINNYLELFNINSKDLALTRDIGISFGLMMEEHKELALRFLISLYKKNIEKTEVFNIPKQNNVRLAISYSFLQLKPMSTESIDFVSLVTLKDSIDTVRKNMTEVCEYYIKSYKKEDLSHLFNLFFDPLNLPPVSSIENNRLRICLCHLCNKILEIDPQFSDQFLDSLINYNIRSPDDDLREICAKYISKIAKKKSAEIPSMIEKLLLTRSSLNKPEKLQGFGYAYSALIHAQGVASLKKDVFNFTDELSNSKNENDRQIVCYIFAGLSYMFGAILEPSLPRILPVLLQSFGDKFESVRVAGSKAIQSIIKNLTHACVERVLPYALEKVENDDSWRIQHTAILLVDSVLNANPRNISKFVPNIVNSLSKAVKSAVSQVREAALLTMDRIKSSITNESVNEIFPFLINAISHPKTLEIALEKISHLNLTQKLDNSSLSLIIPIVINGCQSTNMNTKTNSYKILGNLPLISMDGALSQFADLLIKPLLDGVSDPSPNLRAIAASSLSSIVSCFDQDKYDEIINKLLNEMTQKKTFAERQGNAQAIASLIKTKGIDQLKQQLQQFVNLAEHGETLSVREGYVSLLGFLSHFFGEDFSDCYNITIDAVLNACADPNDQIRTVGLRSASLITKAFSKSNPQLILTPYFSCAMKENWRQRLCAVNFMKSFVYAIAGMTEADEKGIREIGEMLETLETQVSKDVLYPALLTLFILSADPVPTVSNEAQLVWRQIIPNTGQFLRGVMNILLERIHAFTCSEFEVVRTVGACAMALGVKRLKTKFLTECFKSIETQLQEDDIDCVHGAILCIHMLCDLLSQDDKMRACTILAPYLSSPYEQVRNEALQAFVEMRDSIGEQGAKEVSTNLVKYVFNKAEEQGDVCSLSGLLNIIGHHAMVELTRKILQRPVDDKRPEIAYNLTYASGSALDSIMPTFAERMISMSAHPSTEEEGLIALNIAKRVIDALDNTKKEIFASKLVENMRNQQPQNRRASILIASHLLEEECEKFNQIVSVLVRAIIYLLDDPLDDIQIEAIKSIKIVGEKFNVNDVPKLIKEICDTLESICSVSDVRAFDKPESFEALNLLIEAAFETSDQVAIESACTIIATVVPQLLESPIATRKLLARCVYQLQIFNDPNVQMKILKASRALFEKSASQRQMLVNSLPTAYIRLFRSGVLSIQTIASDALCSLAKKVSKPYLIVRCLLQIVKTQLQNVSSTVLNAIIKIVKTIKLDDEETNEIIKNVLPLLKNPKIPIRELTAQVIATSLLSSQPSKLAATVTDTNILKMNDEELPTTLIIFNEILKSGTQEVTKTLLPYVLDLLPMITSSNNQRVMNYIPKICVSLMLCDPENLIPKLLHYIIEIFEKDETEQQVIACQEMHRFIQVKVVKKEDKTQILNTLTNAFMFKAPAVQSAAAKTIFDCFHLDELDENQLKALAATTSTPRESLSAFKEIIELVQADRANQKIVR